MSSATAVVEWPVPVTRPTGRFSLVAVLVVAAALGGCVAVAPHRTLALAAAAVAAVLLLPRLEWAVVALVVSAGFADYLAVVSTWSTEYLMVVLVLAWLVRRARGPIGPDRWRPVLLVTAVFVLVLVAATALHPNGRPGLEIAVRYVALAAVLLVVSDAVAGPVRSARVVRAYVWSCTLAAVVGLATAVAADHHRVSGPLANPDDLAFFLVAAIPLAGVLRYPRRWQRDVVVVVLLLATLGTQSRGAMVALVAMVAMSLAVRALSVRAAAAWLVLLATGVALVLAVVVPQLSGGLNAQQNYVETQVSQRLSVWRAAGTMTLQHPVLGLGPGAFAPYHEDFRESHDELGTQPEVAHSTVLEASAELGVLGGAALLAVFLTPLVGSRARWQTARSRIGVGVAVALVGVLVAALFESEQYAVPLWLLAALVAPWGRARPGAGRGGVHLSAGGLTHHP